MSYIIHCKVCKVAVGSGDGEHPGGDHYCSQHVPKAAHADPEHQYAGARVEQTDPLTRNKK
jgi:hypothetical protein